MNYGFPWTQSFLWKVHPNLPTVVWDTSTGGRRFVQHLTKMGGIYGGPRSDPRRGTLRPPCQMNLSELPISTPRALLCECNISEISYNNQDIYERRKNHLTPCILDLLTTSPSSKATWASVKGPLSHISSLILERLWVSLYGYV